LYTHFGHPHPSDRADFTTNGAAKGLRDDWPQAVVISQLRIPSLTPTHAIIAFVFNNLQGRVIFSIELSSLQRRSVGRYSGLLNR